MGIFFSTESKSDTEVDQLSRRATESVMGLQNPSNESDKGSATKAALADVRDLMAASGVPAEEFNQMVREAADRQKGGRKRSQKGGLKKSKGGRKKSKRGRKISQKGGRKKSKRNNSKNNYNTSNINQNINQNIAYYL